MPRATEILREVWTTPGSVDIGVDIILIPGIGTAPSKSWPFRSPDWFRTVLSPETHRARVLAYEHQLKPNHDFSWEELLAQGHQLLQELDEMRSRLDTNKIAVRPLLCVCHSLGGIILKQALCIANEQLHKYEFLINAMAGIVFLSTPHRSVDKEDTLRYFMSVLKTTSRKTIKIPFAKEEREKKILLDLSNRFEGIFFRTPILSIYETTDTKVSDRMFSTKMQKLVTKATCATNAPMETLLGLELDHLHTCHFEHTSDHNATELDAFIASTLSTATDFITSRLKALEFTYATVSSYSPTASETARIDDHDGATPLSTAKATDGSSQMGFEIIHSPVPAALPEIQPRLPCVILESYTHNDSFQGRDDVLAMIAEAILPPKIKVVASQQTGLRQFALCGLGGMGKTEIAQEFALRHKDDFDAIFWVQADEIAKLDQCYQRISDALGLEGSSKSKNYVISREIVKGWLSNAWKLTSPDDAFNAQTSYGVDWLLIFDNADDPMILTDYWPQGSGSVLITSRDPIAKSIFSMRSHGFDLEPLPDTDGAALMRRLTDTDDDVTDEAVGLTTQISQLLGGIPLALSQMAGIIRRQDLTLAEFLDLYGDATEHPELHKMKFGDASTRTYAHSISTVWAIEDLGLAARTLLEFMAFLDPDNIQESLLMEAMGEMFPNSHVPKNKQYRDLRTELLQSSLIRRNKEKNEVSLHRLVQDAVRAKMDTEKFTTTFGSTVHLLWRNWPSALPKASRPPQFPQPKNANNRFKMSAESRMEFVALLSEATLYQNERGRTGGFDGCLETAEAICKDLKHPDRDSLLANLYFCLGVISSETRRDKKACRESCERSLGLQLNIARDLGIEDERLALAYTEMGLSRLLDDRISEGVACLSREKEIRESLGNYMPQSREANLAYGYMRLGRLEDADQLLRVSIDIREEAFGKNDKESFRTGRLIYMLGNLRALQGKQDESFDHFRIALAQYRANIGDRHAQTANAMYKVSGHLIRLQRHTEAIDMINDALKTWSFDTKVYKPELARTTFMKAKLLKHLGKEQKATVATKVAGRLWQEVTGEKRDPATLTMADFDPLVPFWAR